MKITKRMLKQIIREELENVLKEVRLPRGTTRASQRKLSGAPGPRVGPGGVVELPPGGSYPTGARSDLPVGQGSGEPLPRGREHRWWKRSKRGGRGGHGHHRTQTRTPKGRFGTRIDAGPGKVELERLIDPPGPKPGPKPGPRPRPPSATPWKKFNVCRKSKGRLIACIAGPIIAAWLAWRNSDEYDESLDPVKTPMYNLYTHCGPEQQLHAFPTKESRQAFMAEIKAAGRLPGCDIPSPDAGPPEMKIPPRENQPGSVAFTPAASPPRPEAPAAACQFSVPPQGEEEYDCFYQALHLSGGSSGLEFLEEYGQDYDWKDEHTEAYYELLQSGYRHYNIPTHEELQTYDWYKQVPEHVKDFFKSAQSG